MLNHEVQKAIRECRSIRSIKKIADSALYKLGRDSNGDNSEENKAKLRAHFARGLDPKALELYTKHLTKLAKDNPGCNGLRNLSLAVDYVPMLSATAAMRYGCRQKGCGLIPKNETDWFHAVQPDGQGNAKKSYWFCPACGGQFTYNTKGTEGGETDGRGQDKSNQFVLSARCHGSQKAVSARFAQRPPSPRVSRNSSSTC